MNLIFWFKCCRCKLHLQYFLFSQRRHNSILLHLLKSSPRTTSVCFLCSNRWMMNIRNLVAQESVVVKYIDDISTKFYLKLWFESDWYFWVWMVLNAIMKQSSKQSLHKVDSEAEHHFYRKPPIAAFFSLIK